MSCQTSVMTPINTQHGKQNDLPPLSGKDSAVKSGVKPHVRNPAKSAVVGQSTKFKKVNEDGQLE